MPDVLMHTRDIKRHYAVERALADRLRKAGRSERLTLYAELYNELFKSVPDHPQVTAHTTPEATASETARQFGILCPFLTKDSIVLEIGAGGCHLSQEVARHVRQVYALDVSDEIATRTILPANCKLVLSDGLTVPVPEGSVDVAYSNQLMEHLHPDDAVEQLHNVYRALKPGGAYICITPNALCGPHDVSRGFDREPTGFHLKPAADRAVPAGGVPPCARVALLREGRGAVDVSNGAGTGDRASTELGAASGAPSAWLPAECNQVY